MIFNPFNPIGEVLSMPKLMRMAMVARLRTAVGGLD